MIYIHETVKIHNRFQTSPCNRHAMAVSILAFGLPNFFGQNSNNENQDPKLPIQKFYSKFRAPENSGSGNPELPDCVTIQQKTYISLIDKVIFWLLIYYNTRRIYMIKCYSCYVNRLWLGSDKRMHGCCSRLIRGHFWAVSVASTSTRACKRRRRLCPAVQSHATCNKTSQHNIKKIINLHPETVIPPSKTKVSFLIE